MFLRLISICLLWISFSVIYAQVGIFNDTIMYQIEPSSLLNVSSNDKGLLIPRMSTSQIESISDPANGLLVYNMNRKRIMQYHNGWRAIQNENDYQKFNIFNDTMMLSESGSFVAFDQLFNDLGYDTDPTNEFQTFSIFNDTIMLTGSNSILDLGQLFGNLGYDTDPANEFQTLGIFNDTMMLSGNGSFLVFDEVFEDLGYDMDPENEFQTLGIFNDTMMLIGGTTLSKVAVRDFTHTQLFNDSLLWVFAPIVMNENVPTAFEFDQGRARLNNSFNMIETERDWINFILDTDNNQTNANFALFADATGPPNDAVVSFNLNGFDSWIDSGQFGIGTKVPKSDFHMAHGNNGNADGMTLEHDASNKSWRLFCQADGNLAIYTSENPEPTPIAGISATTGAFVAMSDARFKKDISPLENVLPQLNKLEPMRYHFTHQSEDDKLALGFLAQEVEKIFPEVVHYDAEADRYRMDYSAFGVLAVRAIQEQQAQIETLEQRIARLEKLLIQSTAPTE